METELKLESLLPVSRKKLPPIQQQCYHAYAGPMWLDLMFQMLPDTGCYHGIFYNLNNNTQAKQNRPAGWVLDRLVFNTLAHGIHLSQTDINRQRLRGGST